MTDPPPAPPCKLAGRGVERSETGWVPGLNSSEVAKGNCQVFITVPWLITPGLILG